MFDNWYEKIKKNRESFIEYYVNQFGKENRELITDRFDNLKFCFYVDPNYIKSWIYPQLKEDYVIAAYHFLKNVGNNFDINTSKILLKKDEQTGTVYIDSEDEKVKNKINHVLSYGGIALAGTSEASMFSGLYSFRDLQDFINGEGKDYDFPQEELLERQLLFLMNIGDLTIEGRPMDYFESEECKNFVHSSRFKELVSKYHSLADMALEYKRTADLKYKGIIDYMKKSMQAEKQIVEKYDSLKKMEISSDKIQEYDRACKKEIASLRVICGNFDFSSHQREDVAFNVIIDSGESEQVTVSSVDSMKSHEDIIFFCPFKSIPGCEDVDLRHEIRHGITCSVNAIENGVTYKIGNKIERYIDGKCVECELQDWNEWVTQIEAKKETKDAFSKQIYIVTQPNIANSNFFKDSSRYDKYLPLFEPIYNALPWTAKQSQIELSNDSLYNILSLEQLVAIEQQILHHGYYDDKSTGELDKILNDLKSNDSLIPSSSLKK